MTEETKPVWRYSINYGPEGEQNWANLITPEGKHVANMYTNHARRIVEIIAAKEERIAALIEAVAELGALGNRLEAKLSKAVEALEFFADNHNWRLNRPLDPNGSNFDGTSRARATLKEIGGDHG